MNQPEHTILCLSNFLKEIERLKEVEFPYGHPEEALKNLELLVHGDLSRLRGLGGISPLALKQECTLALATIWQYLPVLGFILRSTNVRNAFEVYGPALRMARQLLEPKSTKCFKTKLLLSSEWTYSPFVYREFPELADFVLIGLPAHESGNPLLIPLAGHECGHRLWALKKHSQTLQQLVVLEIISIITRRWVDYKTAFPLLTAINPNDLGTNLFARETYRSSITWALRQLEETFCDFIGAALFGKSYLYAFAYILSPSVPAERALWYPGLTTRVRNLVRISNKLNIDIPSSFAADFQDSPTAKLSPSEKFQSEVADEVLSNLLPEIEAKCILHIAEAKLELPKAEEERKILEHFKIPVPAENVANWVSILNAGWVAHEDADFWKNSPPLLKEKERILKELILKNIEIFEIEQILKETS